MKLQAELYTGHEVEGCEQCNHPWHECKCTAEFIPISDKERERIRKDLAFLFAENLCGELEL